MAQSKLDGKRRVAPVDPDDSSAAELAAPPSKSAKTLSSTSAKVPPAKRPRVADSDSSSDVPAPKAKAKAKVSPAKAKQVQDSDDTSDEVASKVHAKVKSKEKPAVEDSDDSSDEVAPKVKAKAKAKTKPAVEDSDDSSDEVAPKVKAKAEAKTKPAVEDSDDSSDEVAPKVKAKAKAKTKPAVEDSDDSSDEVAPKAKAKAKTKTEPAVEDSDDSPEVGNAEAKAAPKTKTVPTSKTREDESEESDSDFVVTVAPKRKVAEVAEVPTEAKAPEAKKGRPGSAAGKADLEVFIGGLSWDCVEASLREDFEECGEIANIHMPMSEEKKSKGVAFFTYKTIEGVEAALKYNGTEYGGRTLTVRMSSNKPEYSPNKGGGRGQTKGSQAAKSTGQDSGGGEFEVFVNGIPYDCDEAQFTKDFEKCGKIKDILMPVSNGVFKGIAFITYETKQGVDAALKFNGVEYGGRKLQVRMSSERPSTGRIANTGDRIDELTAFVSGVSFNITEEQLRKDFGVCGTITRFVMPLNDDSKPKGVAFIQFEDKVGLDKAIAKFNGKEYGRAGRWLNVEMFGARARGDHRKTAVKKGKGKSKGSGSIEEFTAVVSGLSASVEETGLQRHFEECGEIERLSLPTPHGDSARPRLAFIQFKTKEALEKALTFNGKEYAGDSMKVRIEGTGLKKGNSKGDGSKGKDDGEKPKKSKKKITKCKFFTSPAGCQKGDTCEFEHVEKKAPRQDDE